MKPSFLVRLSVNKLGVWQGGFTRLENAHKGRSPVTLFLCTFPSFQVTLEETIWGNLVRTVLGTSTHLSFLWANLWGNVGGSILWALFDVDPKFLKSLSSCLVLSPCFQCLSVLPYKIIYFGLKSYMWCQLLTKKNCLDGHIYWY